LQKPISKITKAKWTGGVAQAVDGLLCKLKALSSNSGNTKKKKKVKMKQKNFKKRKNK
jgi:hypothetical protein